MKKITEFKWKNLRPTSTMAVAALALTTAATLTLVAALVIPSTIRADSDEGSMTFTVDVTQTKALNAQNNVDPLKPPDSFARGDTFIVDGPIYPRETIPVDIADPPPNAHIIGTYRIRGTFLIGADDFNLAVRGGLNAPQLLAFATESFSFADDGATILVDGVWPNARRSAHRVVLGGTGRFRNVVGEVYEQNIGENTDSFCNSRVTFRLRKVSGGRHDW
jgi:hypothetical protein